MINNKTLAGLAVATAVLFAIGAAIGPNRDILWIVDDILWIGFLLCALALVLVSLAIVVRWVTRTARSPSKAR